MDARKLSEKEYHDKVFEDGTRETVAKYYTIAAESRRLYRSYLENNCPGKRALEYGCGPESYAFVMARKGAHVTGIDISDVAIEEVQKLAAQEKAGKRTDFRVMDAEALDFPGAEFDLICGTGILHHLDLKKAYPELARVLRADGSAIFVEPLGHNPLIRLYRALTPKLRTADEHPLLMRDLENARTHFRQMDVIYLHLFCLLAVPFRRFAAFPRILNRLERLDRWLFTAMPFLGRYAWMIILILREPRPASTKQNADSPGQEKLAGAADSPSVRSA